MTSKRKLSRKRGSDHLGDTISRVIDASEIIVNTRSKKRKNGNGEILNYENREAIDAQLQSHSHAIPDGSQQKYENKYSFAEVGRKILPAIGGSSKEKYARTRYKKTYACLSKIKLSANQFKNKQNIAANNALHNTVHINTNKNVDYKSTIGDNMENKKQQVISHSADILPAGSNDMQVTANSNSMLKNGKGCLIYVQSPSFADGRAQRTTAEEGCSPLIVEQHQVVDIEQSKDECIKIGSLISTKLMPYVSHSHNPVLKSVDRVTGISTTISMPTLSANTSPITAISTPIPTISKLPDVLGNVSKSEVICHGQRTLSLLNTSQQRDHPHPGSSFDKERSKQHQVFPKSCNVTIHDNQESVFPLKYAETQPSIPFPAHDIIIEDVKEENTEILDVKSDITINFNPSETVKTNSTSPGFLQVDTWATHMLQNLELLYKNERHCDLFLKFCGGEVLKVHRTVMSACTSLLSGADAMQDKNELEVPADLSYASVEPLIKFIYSGRLEVQKSASEISAIYSAAKRLKLSLLTDRMDLHFPYLSQSSVESSTSLGDTKIHRKQISTKSNSCSTVLASQSSFQGNSCKTVTSKTTAITSFEENGKDNNTKSLQDDYDIKIEEIEGEDASVYYLVTNSRKYPLSTSPLRCLKATEEARPTRFELKEESENSSEGVTWSTTPSTPPYVLPSIPVTISSTHPPVYTSASAFCSSTETCSYTPSSPSQTFKKRLFMADGKVTKKQPHMTSHASSQDQMTGSADSSLNIPNESNDDVTDIHENNQNRKNESREKNVDLMEKISSICRQLEEREVSDVNIQDTNFGEEKYDDKSPSSSSKNKVSGKEESSLAPNTLTPVKSILKKKKNKTSARKEPKHVSFQLDENNELINEVATFSLSKEPAQSLIDVQKTKGTHKSLNSTPMKLSASMKKKVLMNLSLSDSETISSSSFQGKKSLGKKGGNSNQSHSKNHINRGDITSHAKLISEVLKKYPHLVKDKKKIGLKILKKGNEKEGGGKAKSKVQYLVLSDADCKSKSPAKSYKASSWTKHGPSISQTVHTFECPECNNKIFKTYFMLKKHVFSEHKDKSSAILAHIENVPYACYTCFVNEPLEFANYFSYQQHMKDIHSKTELRLCNICGFRPGRKLELAYHQYTEHNKVSRSFCFPKCDLCDHVAMNDHALLKHRSQHTNADNYTCSVCGVKFCSFGALQGHMQTKLCQTKPSVSYKCPHCPLTFTRSYNLKAHCRSSHKSLQTSTLSRSGAIEKQAETLTSLNSESQSKETRGGNPMMQITSNSKNEKEHTVNPENECEPLVANIQSSSEAEALSTVANSLVTSLRLPEENVNNYIYSEDHNINYSNTNDEKNMEDSSQPVSHTIQLAVPPISEHQSHPQCYDKSHSVQAPIQDSTNIGALYPISVVSSEVHPSHIVPGQIFSSHILPAGCLNSPTGPVLGAASQSWTYVTYQVPSTSEDTSLVLTETASINIPPQNSHQSTSTENVYHTTTTMTTKEDMEVNISHNRCIESSTSVCQELTPVAVTDADMNTNVNQISLPEAHTYHTLSSPAV